MLGATPQQLERNLRVAIREAWERGDRALLRRLLPWCSDACPPETKGFLFGLAARLRASAPEDVLPRSGGNGEREAGRRRAGSGWRAGKGMMGGKRQPRYSRSAQL